MHLVGARFHAYFVAFIVPVGNRRELALSHPAIKMVTLCFRNLTRHFFCFLENLTKRTWFQVICRQCQKNLCESYKCGWYSCLSIVRDIFRIVEILC